jgi:hypothetical protein
MANDTTHFNSDLPESYWRMLYFMRDLHWSQALDDPMDHWSYMVEEEKPLDLVA